MKATFVANVASPISGGILTVTNGSNNVALNLLGDYTHATWNLSKDSSGKGTLVVDPLAKGSPNQHSAVEAEDRNDFSKIGFNADIPLLYSPNDHDTGGAFTVSDRSHAMNPALLNQYMASSFVMAGDDHRGTLITDPSSNLQTFLSQPHTAG
jgi:hypothetical protein